MIEVGVNSYVDVEFADNYVKNYYKKYNPIAVHYSVLTTDEKEQYLLQSIQQLNNLKFIGQKFTPFQPLQFPRRVDNYRSSSAVPYYKYVGGIMPIEILNAQVENALGILSAEITSVSDKQFMTMQSLGAVKNTKYNKREAGDLGFGDELKGSNTQTLLSSSKAYSMAQKWIGGSFNVR